MRRAISVSFVALVLVVGLAPGVAQSVAIGALAGSQGAGLSVTGQLSSSAQARLLASRYRLQRTVSTSDVDYDGDLQVGGLFALLDWYPGSGGFRVSAGLGWSANELDVTAPLEDLARREIPDLPPLPFDLGDAVGTARGDDFVPLVLIGWGNPFGGSRWGASLDLGVLYQGELDVELEPRTSLPVDDIPGARELLAALADEEERALERELEEYTLLPIVSLSVTFRF